MCIPANPKIYHIVHVDNLGSIINSTGLFSDRYLKNNNINRQIIGMDEIKERRLTKLRLKSYPDLYVGDCVPFYFCPRSIMLYVIHERSSSISYKGGQESIIHLEADLYKTIQWADEQKRRWAFTSSNAGSYYFEDFKNIKQLGNIDWNSVRSISWRNHKEGKQAEFLIEDYFPLCLVERIGVLSPKMMTTVSNIKTAHSVTHPPCSLQSTWYY